MDLFSAHPEQGELNRIRRRQTNTRQISHSDFDSKHGSDSQPSINTMSSWVAPDFQTAPVFSPFSSTNSALTFTEADIFCSKYDENDSQLKLAEFALKYQEIRCKAECELLATMRHVETFTASPFVVPSKLTISSSLSGWNVISKSTAKSLRRASAPNFINIPPFSFSKRSHSVDNTQENNVPLLKVEAAAIPEFLINASASDFVESAPMAKCESFNNDTFTRASDQDISNALCNPDQMDPVACGM